MCTGDRFFGRFDVSLCAQVVGGMCWSLTSIGAAVDVDVFYNENLNLGQKMCVPFCLASSPTSYDARLAPRRVSVE